ncbi:unnamed protein product [Orchesella dallaii]|uniref:CRAL-TRIO domain-containing protein n=1 Tax=Orchesella dallaii TaxID=48710 RepID=A0ABP1RBP1_9HEXA
MALPSKEELLVLDTFRAKVADILSEEEVADDMFLLRWLRARDLNLEKAEGMLRSAIKWRKENHMDDTIIKKPIDPFYHENYPRWVDGMDKEGRPIFSAAFGRWDVRKVVKQGKNKEFVDYLTDGFELVVKAIKRSAEMHPAQPGKPPITQVVCVYDWEGFAWGQLLSYQSVQNFLQFGSIYEAYYPEILHSCYFINCPSVISTVLTLLRPVIAPKTMDKIKCIGTDKEAWKAEFNKRFDAEQLRPQFGGTKLDDSSNPFL